jgi:hypothetical protein
VRRSYNKRRLRDAQAIAAAEQQLAHGAVALIAIAKREGDARALVLRRRNGQGYVGSGLPSQAPRRTPAACPCTYISIRVYGPQARRSTR